MPEQTHLTVRQMEVLVLVCEGLTNKEIGEKISLAPQTVRNHLSGLYRILGVQNRTQAVLKAVEMGIVGLKVKHPRASSSGRRASR